MKLVFYLFDEVVDDFTGVFLDGKIDEGEGFFEPIPLREPDDDIAVFLQYNKPGRPAWINFFEAHCDFEDRRPVNQHNSLVVVFRIHPPDGDRFLALTAGQGHLALDKSLIEDGFGLTVTLNAVNPTRLRGMEARDLGTRTQQKKLAVTYESEVWEFAYDPDTEVVGAISGVPSDEISASRYQGRIPWPCFGRYGGMNCWAYAIICIRPTTSAIMNSASNFSQISARCAIGS